MVNNSNIEVNNCIVSNETVSGEEEASEIDTCYEDFPFYLVLI
jgi:hypothetical protein